MLNERGDPLSIVSNRRIPDPASGNPSGYRIQSIVNPTWFSKFDEVETRPGLPTTGRLVFRYLMADDNGVYQLEPSADPRFMDVQWMLSADDYFWMTGKRLRAASVRRLSAAANNTTLCPRAAQTRAASSPAGPPPTTTIFFFFPLTVIVAHFSSRPITGFCTHVTPRPV